MGFYSWICPCCGHSIRHLRATNPDSSWLADAVFVFANGDTLSGIYNGYGEVGGFDLEDSDERCFDVYHRACRTIAGRTPFAGGSEAARDQGHFVGEYDPSEPKNAHDLEALLAYAKKEKERVSQEAKVEMARMRAGYIAEGKEVPSWLRS